MEITQEQCGDLRFQVLALLTLQEAVRAYIVNLFEDAHVCAVHAKWVNFIANHNVQLARRI